MEIKLIDGKEIQTETQTGLVLVDFFTPSCGPCRMMKPVLEQCTEFVKVIKVDASKDLETSAEFKISAVPTLVLFKDGKEVNRVVGVQNKEKIRKMVQEAQ